MTSHAAAQTKSEIAYQACIKATQALEFFAKNTPGDNRMLLKKAKYQYQTGIILGVFRKNDKKWK